MSKRITSARSAAKPSARSAAKPSARSAAKRAAFTQQKQKFNTPYKVPKYVEVGFGVGAEETYLRHQLIFWKQWSKNYYG